ncbi:MAG: LysM peptidoglycan-binding domain-containing protein [Gemmatimonadaceae bacterium]
MATSVSSSPVDQSGRDHDPAREPLLRRPRRRMPSAVWFALAAFGFALVIVLVQLALYTRRSEPRDARAIVERELRMNTLQPGERVLRSVPVFRRNASDYFRQTRGLLVLTDRRLVYLGAPPRDITGASDGPPTFDQQEFRIDTLVRLDRSFTLLGVARALDVESPDGKLNVGIPSGAWPQAELLRQMWDVRHKKLYAIGVWGARVRAARAQLQKELEEYRRQPVYHVVRAGDAISSIASWYETSPDSIAQLNGIVGTKIKVGQRLLIRSGS